MSTQDPTVEQEEITVCELCDHSLKPCGETLLDFICTRERGHPGVHMACGVLPTEHPTFAWSQGTPGLVFGLVCICPESGQALTHVFSSLERLKGYVKQDPDRHHVMFTALVDHPERAEETLQ